MRTVNVKIEGIGKSYNIDIAKDLLDNISSYFQGIDRKKALLVTNETIFELYKDRISEVFPNTNLQIEYCILPDGEVYKNDKSLNKILTCAFESKFSRKDIFIAFGGGVIGDITGFAAAIYMRGLDFIQIPTTLLAQVDSSVGGKVAINTSYGKNLIGAFWQPKMVLSDLSLLKTLPKREILTGFAEIIKYSFIEKNSCFTYSDFSKFLSDNVNDALNLKADGIEYIIQRCCELKAWVVSQDEKESGLRKILNFGHTIGHSIEKCTNYNTFTHGEAISIGMKVAFLLSYKLDKIKKEYFDFALCLLNAYGLNFKIPKNVEPEIIVEMLDYDKKATAGKIQFVLPIDYATVELCDNIERNLILEIVRELY